MYLEMFISVLLVFFIIIVLGFLYLWLLWLMADVTNP